jgi:hypothetical protein
LGFIAFNEPIDRRHNVHARNSSPLGLVSFTGDAFVRIAMLINPPNEVVYPLKLVLIEKLDENFVKHE